MRKLDIFVKENFNGNMDEALKFLLFSSGDECLSNYIDELTREEALIVANLMKETAIKKYGGEAAFNEQVKIANLLATLDITEDEVKNAVTNPYKATILKNSLKMLIMEGGIIALSVVAPAVGISMAAVGAASTIATGLFSMTIANNLVDYFRFKKVKKLMDANTNTIVENTENRGRGL